MTERVRPAEIAPPPADAPGHAEPPASPRRAAALDSSGVPGVLIAGGDQRIAAANGTLLAWLDRSLDDLRGLTIADICAKGPEWTEAAWARYRREGAWDGDVVLRAADGRLLPRHVKATIVRAGTTETYVSVISDPAEYDAVERARATGGDIFARGLPPALHEAVARAIAHIEMLGAAGGAGTYARPSQSAELQTEAVERLRAELMRVTELHRRIETSQLFTLRDPADRTGAERADADRVGAVRADAGQDGAGRGVAERAPAADRDAPGFDVLACPRPEGLLTALDLPGEYQTYSKPSMVVLSHAIEDALHDAEAGGLLLTGLQRYSLLLPEMDRYRALAARVAAIHVWGLPDANLESGLPENMHLHPVPPADPLLRSWFVVAWAPDFWSALLAEDVSGFGVRDPLRRFRGGWTSDRRGIEGTVAWIAAHAGTPPPVVMPSYPPPTPDALLRHEVLTRKVTTRLFRHLDRAVAARQAALEGQRELASDNARLFHREEALRREAERLAELQKLLSHSAVHDLRNTLTLSLGSLELLLMDHGGPLNHEQRELIETALLGTTRTIELAQTILDLARFEAGAFPLTRSPLDVAALGELLERVAGPRRTLGQAIAIDVAGPVPPAQVDRDILERVLANLLDNAMKYAPRSPVDLTVRADAQAFEIAVRDRGPGIPAHARSDVFAPFRQATDGQARQGSGLGLAFCRLAVEAHGGSIRLESPPDGGARFAIALPL